MWYTISHMWYTIPQTWIPWNSLYCLTSSRGQCRLSLFLKIVCWTSTFLFKQSLHQWTGHHLRPSVKPKIDLWTNLRCNTDTKKWLDTYWLWRINCWLIGWQPAVRVQVSVTVAVLFLPSLFIYFCQRSFIVQTRGCNTINWKDLKRGNRYRGNLSQPQNISMHYCSNISSVLSCEIVV